MHFAHLEGDQKVGVEWDPDMKNRPKPKWYRNLNKETIRQKQLNAAMDPNFDPYSLSKAGVIVHGRFFE